MIQIDNAFIVAAGKGTRMAPLTDTMPKPLVPIAGRPLIDYIFDHLQKTSVRHVTVNTHYLAQQLRDYLATRQDVTITESFEEVLLETGGGLQKALPHLGAKPIFMINGDAFWTNGPSGPILPQLAKTFDIGRMDILLLLIPVTRMEITQGVGDYDILPNGQARRNHFKKGTHMFTGIRILDPAIMQGVASGAFSFLQQMDAAEAKGRLYAMVHDGEWHHISTPEDLNRINAHQLLQRKRGEKR